MNKFLTSMCFLLLCLIGKVDLHAQVVDSTKIGVSKIFNLKKNTTRNTQGAARFNNYFFQCHNNNGIIDIYDLNTNEYVNSIRLVEDSLTHCNNVDFGREYYSKNDRFPLLYVQVREKYHRMLVFRIVENDSIMNLEKVQTIDFEPMSWCTTTLDVKKRRMYVLHLGKTHNYLSTFKLPKLSEGDVVVHKDSALRTIDIPKVKEVQDATIHGKYMYRIYGFKDQGVLGVFDLKKNVFVGLVNLPDFGMNAEPEGIVYHNGSLIVTFLNREAYRITIEKGAFK